LGPYWSPNGRHSDCPLMTFVPEGRRNLPFPHRHIPLNAEGYTLDSMYRNNSQQEIEEAVRSWLKRTISQLAEDENTTTRSPVVQHSC
jgi:hypothetical protein